VIDTRDSKKGQNRLGELSPMLSLLDMIWTKTKIAFDVKDPLKPTGQDFSLPNDWSDLSPAEKRRLTICNLFANQQQSIEQISYYLEASRKEVIVALISEGLLVNQRGKPRALIVNGRREEDSRAQSPSTTY
jgi:hypothetical protein